MQQMESGNTLVSSETLVNLTDITRTFTAYAQAYPQILWINNNVLNESKPPEGLIK